MKGGEGEGEGEGEKGGGRRREGRRGRGGERELNHFYNVFPHLLGGGARDHIHLVCSKSQH